MQYKIDEVKKEFMILRTHHIDILKRRKGSWVSFFTKANDKFLKFKLNECKKIENETRELLSILDDAILNWSSAIKTNNTKLANRLTLRTIPTTLESLPAQFQKYYTAIKLATIEFNNWIKSSNQERQKKHEDFLDTHKEITKYWNFPENYVEFLKSYKDFPDTSETSISPIGEDIQIEGLSINDIIGNPSTLITNTHDPMASGIMRLIGK